MDSEPVRAYTAWQRAGRACLLAAALVSWSIPGLGDDGEDNGSSPLSVEGAETVSVEQAHRLFLAGAAFVDVRNPRLHARRHIPGAHHLDLSSAFNKPALEQVVAKDQPLVIYCSGQKCRRSSRAAEFAVEWGFTSVKYFRDGIVGWRDAGLPTAQAE